MQALSTSLVLGKASSPHGANVEHNNREFIADNVDVNRICDNVVYVQQEIREAYQELFGDALNEYNAKQKRNDRRIEDYYEHIENGSREESFYEIVVQFGDSKVAPVGSHNGEIAKNLLDEYMKSFQERNPNLHIFNAVLHVDEVSPHLHIDFIPFYNENRKIGMSKGVSMRAALEEQGFSNKSRKSNSLVEWEDSELKAMEKILNRHGLKRETKNATYAHMSVDEYKESQDEKKITSSKPWKAENTIEQLQQDNALLKTEKEKLTEQKFSPWKSFYYAIPEKQSFVQAKLDELKIPYRESENGIEAQECYVEEIRKVEKSFVSKENPHRDTLRNNLDKIIMQSKSYDEVLQRLTNLDYTVKQGKYIAVKPKSGNQFIRLKSLGVDYSEQAIKNRMIAKHKFEADINAKINNSKNKDSLEHNTLITVKQYTIIFARGFLPMRKVNQKKPFAWTNCEELDRLTSLNKRINEGTTLESLRNEFANLEKSVSVNEDKLEKLNTELEVFENLYHTGVRCFENGENNLKDIQLLTKHKITSENYGRVQKLINENKSDIEKLEISISSEREKLKNASDTLTVIEKIAGGTFVQSLVDDEKHRQQTKYIQNGLKRAD